LFLCQHHIDSCLPSLLIFAFEGKTWTGHGDGAAICESTGGIPVFIGETRGLPQREAEALRPRLFLWKNHCLGVSQGAALSPCPGGDFEVSDSIVFFEKLRGASILIPVTIRFS
jgi:hypothetical protein